MSYKIYHPDVEGLGTVEDLSAYRQVWAPRGWQLLGEHESAASEVLGRPVTSLDDIKVDEWRFLLASRDLEPLSGSAKKAEYEKAFTSSFAEVAPSAEADAAADANKTTGATAPVAAPSGNTDNKPKGS